MRVPLVVMDCQRAGPAFEPWLCGRQSQGTLTTVSEIPNPTHREMNVTYNMHTVLGVATSQAYRPQKHKNSGDGHGTLKPCPTEAVNFNPPCQPIPRSILVMQVCATISL